MQPPPSPWESPWEPPGGQKLKKAEALVPKQQLVTVEPQAQRLQEQEPAARLVWCRSPVEDRPRDAPPGQAQALSLTER